tara:strand:- start:24030 stop:24458 length:429 start_codon:yes stop_codon:yes gene_type:complete
MEKDLDLLADEQKEQRKAAGRLRAGSMIGADGGLLISASKMSRGAIAVAFEMMGGVERFAEWAEDNPDDFYIKMFGKTIGREVEHSKAVEVEDILDILDGEAEDITDVTFEDLPPAGSPQPAPELKLSRMAAAYANGEELDD